MLDALTIINIVFAFFGGTTTVLLATIAYLAKTGISQMLTQLATLERRQIETTMAVSILEREVAVLARNNQGYRKS